VHYWDLEFKIQIKLSECSKKNQTVGIEFKTGTCVRSRERERTGSAKYNNPSWSWNLRMTFFLDKYLCMTGMTAVLTADSDVHVVPRPVRSAINQPTVFLVITYQPNKQGTSSKPLYAVVQCTRRKLKYAVNKT